MIHSMRSGLLRAACVAVALGPIACAGREVTAARGEGDLLFSYEEGGDVLVFRSPKTIRLVRTRENGTRTTCESELPEQGNAWTARDVESAFRNAEVQDALDGPTLPYGSKMTAKLSSRGHEVVFARECKKCLPLSAGLDHLQEVLSAVLANRRTACP